MVTSDDEKDADNFSIGNYYERAWLVKFDDAIATTTLSLGAFAAAVFALTC